MTTTTIPKMLVETYGNMSEVARRLGVQRQTIATYARDHLALAHAVVNGTLMTASNKKGNRCK